MTPNCNFISNNALRKTWLTARMLAELMTGEKPYVEAAPFRPGRYA